MEAITREEQFMAAAAGQAVEMPEPITRREKSLKAIADAVQSGGASAEVIQAAVNKYLEENPVEAVGGAEWKLLKTIIVEEDVSSIDVNTDDGGNAFSHEQIFIHASAQNCVEFADTALGMCVYINGNDMTVNSTNWAFKMGGMKNGATGRSWLYIASVNPIIAFASPVINSNVVDGKTVTVTNQPVGVSGNPLPVGVKIISLQIRATNSNMRIGAGSAFEIYGR